MKLYRIFDEDDIIKYSTRDDVIGIYRYVGLIGNKRQYEFLGKLLSTHNYKNKPIYNFSIGKDIENLSDNMLYVEFNTIETKMNEGVPTNYENNKKNKKTGRLNNN